MLLSQPSSTQGSSQGLSHLFSQQDKDVGSLDFAQLSLSQQQSPSKPPPRPKPQAVAPSASQCATSAAAPDGRYNCFDSDGPPSDDDGGAGLNPPDDMDDYNEPPVGHNEPPRMPPFVYDPTERKETHARPPLRQEEMRTPQTSVLDIDLLAYVNEQLKRLKIQEEKIHRSIDDAKHEALEQKHADVETFQSDAKWCGWGTTAPIEAKIDFVQRQTDFGLTVNPILVGKYIITLEQLCATPHTGHVIELLFGPLITPNPRVDERRFDVYKAIEANLAFCDMIKHETALRNTPFAKMTLKEYRQRIYRLQCACQELKRWHMHAGLARDQIATGQPIRPLYEPPPVPDDNKQNDDRDEIKEGPEHKLLDFMFNRAGEQFLRRTEKSVYKEIKTPDGHDTRCFEHLADMVPWMRAQVLPKQKYKEQYNWLMKKGDMERYLSSHLGKQSDPRFPWLRRCRTLFSFRNGIYDATKNEFYVYVTTESTLGSHLKTVFDLPFDVATARYFDETVDLDWFKPECKGNYTWSEEKNGWRTKTPGVLTPDEKGNWREAINPKEHEKIFKAQDYSYENGMLCWSMALLGRLCHEVNSIESWQTALHFEGPAKTGKSVLLKLIMMWYYATDIGLMSDSFESSFSDSHLYQRFIVMAMDCRFFSAFLYVCRVQKHKFHLVAERWDYQQHDF